VDPDADDPESEEDDVDEVSADEDHQSFNLYDDIPPMLFLL
jgi:hypothetical protein